MHGKQYNSELFLRAITISLEALNTSLRQSGPGFDYLLIAGLPSPVLPLACTAASMSLSMAPCYFPSEFFLSDPSEYYSRI